MSAYEHSNPPYYSTSQEPHILYEQTNNDSYNSAVTSQLEGSFSTQNTYHTHHSNQEPSVDYHTYPSNDDTWINEPSKRLKISWNQDIYSNGVGNEQSYYVDTA